MNKKIIAVIVVVTALVLSYLLVRPKTFVYEFDGKKVDADTYYEMLQETYGTAYIMQYLEKVYFTPQKVNEETQKSIDTQEANILAQNDTEDKKNMLDLTLKSFGYDGLNELNLYLKNSHVKNQILEEKVFDYFKDDAAFLESQKPRILSHILIVSDEKTITSDIQSKMDQIDAILNESEDIKMDMILLNDGEAIIAEQLGYVDIDSTNLDAAFLEAALKVGHQELGPWVKSQFGYHRIYVESAVSEDLKTVSAYVQTILQKNPKLSTTILLDEMKSNGLELSETLEKDIFDLLEVAQ